MLPAALKIGLPEYEFFHMTPAAINRRITAYNDRLKSENDDKEYFAWLIGFYTQFSIGSAFNGDEVKYPEKPFYSNIEADKDSDNVKNDKAEAEIRRLDALTRRANHKLEIQSKKLMESNGEV